MATRVWLGGAVPIAQEDEVILDGAAWTAADTITLTINGKALVYTVATDTSNNDVATGIANMINGAAKNNDEGRNTTGDKVGEFARLTASDTTGTITIVADDAGVPFTLSVTENGSGSLTHNTDGSGNSVAVTGPWHFDDADNWSGDTVPVSTDDLIFDHRAVNSLKYELDQSAILMGDCIITSGFEHDIGLPEINEDQPDLPYDEYRGTYLQIGVALAGTSKVQIGKGEGPGSGRIKLDQGENQVAWEVNNPAQPAEQGIPAVLLKGNDTENTLDVFRGSVGVAFFDDEISTVKTVQVGNRGSVISDAQVIFGRTVTLNGSGSTISVFGGTTLVQSSLLTLNIDGGEVEVTDDPDGTASTATTANVRDGTLIYTATGTLTTANLDGPGAILDLSRNLSGVTITNCTALDGSEVRDPSGRGTWTNGIIVSGSISAINLSQWRRNVAWTPVNQ